MVRVALDLEGVLVRVNEALIERETDVTVGGREATVDDMTSWSWPIEVFGEDEYMGKTKEMWESGDVGVYVSATNGVYDVTTPLYEAADRLDVVTARNNVDAVIIHEWLAEHGIKYDSLEIVADGEEKAEMGYDVYIDDNPHLHKHLTDEQLQVLPERPWNEGIHRPNTVMCDTTIEAIRYTMNEITSDGEDERTPATDLIEQMDVTWSDVYGGDDADAATGDGLSDGDDSDSDEWYDGGEPIDNDDVPFPWTLEPPKGSFFLNLYGDDEPSGDEMASMVAEDVSNLLTDSRDTHGDAIENQQHIADGWTWYLRGKGLLAEDEALTGSDAARMMGILKMSRSAVGEEIVDSDRDIAGYGSIAAADQVARGEADVDDLQEYTDE